MVTKISTKSFSQVSIHMLLKLGVLHKSSALVAHLVGNLLC